MNRKRALLSLLAISLCFPVGADLVIGPGETVSEEPPYWGMYMDDLAIKVEKGGTWQPKLGVWLWNGSLDWSGTIDVTATKPDPENDAFLGWSGVGQEAGARLTIHDGATLKGLLYIKDNTNFVDHDPDFREYECLEGYSSLNIANTSLVKLADDAGNVTLNMEYQIKGLDLSGNPSELYITHASSALGIATFSSENDKDSIQDLYDRLDLNVEYVQDSPLYKYLVQLDYRKSDLTEYTDAVENKYYSFSWNLYGLKLTNTNIASESVMAAADNQRALYNLWRMNDSHVFQRGESLRMGRAAHSGNTWRESEPKVSEGVWANVYRGKYKFDSPYGRKVNQSYTSLFIGIDKMNEGDFHNGTLYRGVFADIGTSDASYPTGKGELESKGLGAYVTWQGNKGHFLDAAVRFDKLDNEYTYVDSYGKSGKNKYDTWAWGVSGQYGYHKEWGSGTYIEPLIGLSYGRMNATSYTLHNGLAFDQKGGDFLVGRAGLRFGKVYKDALSSNETNIYGKVMLSHEFLDAADASTMFGGNTLKVAPIGERDTWADVTFGINRSFTKRGSGYVELTKSIGGDVRSDWQVAAGLSFYWDPEPKYHGGPREETNTQFFTAANSAGASTVLAPNVAAAPAGSGSMTETAAVASAETAGAAAEAETYSGTAAQTNAAEAAASDYGTTAFSRAGTYGSVRDGVYELAPVTVESDRPVWEKTLSPGTVSVVYPEAYKGEMKTVPDMLDSVAGVFVQRVNGTGHYTLARVRGSTGQQVNVYVDGVLMNSSGETGVDLSQLPTEQIERIEVYKGYIPARFAGAAIGGAINIVTKKPEGTQGSVGFGMRSYGGYTENLSVTTPVGDGTLLFTLNRDQADGDFGYTWHPQTDPAHVTGIMAGSNVAGDRVWRQDNWYRTTDAMVKWQDAHWLVKAQYVEKNEGAPVASLYDDGDNWHAVPIMDEEGHRFGNRLGRGSGVSQKNRNTDILVGRRQQTGDLEWGAYVNYGYHKKENRWHNGFTPYTPAAANSYYEHTFWGGRIDGSWKINDSNMLEFLFNYSDETMKTDGNSYGTPKYTSAQNSYRAFLPKYDIKHYYFQVQDSMALDRRKTFIFTPEFRAEKMDMTTFDHGKGNFNSSMPADLNEDAWKYSYGLGLKKYISDTWTVRGSYGTYYRAPNFYEMFGDGGVFVRPKPDTLGGGILTWESGKQFDIGTDWKGKTFGADTNVSLTYFNRHVKNMASPVYTPDGTIYYVNYGEGKIDGIELEADWSWKNWELSQTVTYNHSRMDKVAGLLPSESTDVSDRNLMFPMTPKWETNTRLAHFFRDRKMSVFAEYHYTSDMIYTVGSTTGSTGIPNHYKALGTFNLGFKYNPEHWRFTVGVNDLFNKGSKQKLVYEDAALETNVFYPQQGRTYYFSAQYSF